jgi:formate dehydrogenase maturation protein FdhE
MPRAKYVKRIKRGGISLHIAAIQCVRARYAPANCATNHRPIAGRNLHSRSMGVKYYTHFVLTGEAAAGSDQEFSGVVEVNQATDQRYETREIEALLARNFDLRSSDVRLINWARLQ